jgi:hypothetical protein
MTHCVCCDRLLSDYEATIKNAVTFEYMDLCKVCLEDVKPFTKLIDRKDLITEQDLDDCEDFDDEMDSKPSLEDFDDIMYYVENSKDFRD